MKESYPPTDVGVDAVYFIDRRLSPRGLRAEISVPRVRTDRRPVEDARLRAKH